VRQLVGILTLSALVAATVGCQGRSPGSAKPTGAAEKSAKTKLERFNQTDINSYPAGSSSYSRVEADRHITFLKNYIKDGEDVLRYSKQNNKPLDNKKTIESNIETAKALIKSHEGQGAELDKGDKSYGHF